MYCISLLRSLGRGFSTLLLHLNILYTLVLVLLVVVVSRLAPLVVVVAPVLALLEERRELEAEVARVRVAEEDDLPLLEEALGLVPGVLALGLLAGVGDGENGEGDEGPHIAESSSTTAWGFASSGGRDMCWWRGERCRGEVEARGFPGSPRLASSRPVSPAARHARRRLAIGGLIGSASDISYRGGLGGHVVGRARRTQARAHFRQGHTWQRAT